MIRVVLRSRSSGLQAWLAAKRRIVHESLRARTNQFFACRLLPRRVRLQGTGGRTTHTLAILALIATVQGTGALTAYAASSSVTRLGPDGIGRVRFGLPKGRAVARLSVLFGPPTARGVNTGCGPRYTEVEWGDLVAEFRLKKFSGYRYIAGGYPLTTPGSPRAPRRKAVFPRLATSGGITLESTLAQLRSAYPGLHLAGAGKWRLSRGLVFVDNAGHDPELLSNRIIEIKIGTCGDF